MQTIKMKISGRQMELQEALDAAETLGKQGGLNDKELLRLRLLVEELTGILRGIAGGMYADYHMEQEGRKYTLTLEADVALTREMREQIISLSSSGRNADARGFMGKIREMIASALLPGENGLSLLSSMSLGFSGMPAGELNSSMAIAHSMSWSMIQYKAALRKLPPENGEEKEAWDELEKSVVASIADEVSVNVQGSHVAITIYKTF